MKKIFVIIIGSFILLFLFFLFYGCNETTHTAERVPPPPVATTPPTPTPSPTPTPTPTVTLATTTLIPPPEPTPVPVEKPKLVKRPVPKYVIINAPTGILGASKIDVFSKPSNKSQVVSKVASGTKLELLSIQGTWMKIKTPEGKIGWISSSFREK